MTFVVLFILAIVWAIYLASWFKSRAQGRSANSISSFNKHLSVLERTRPAGIVAPTLRPVGTNPNSGLPTIGSSPLTHTYNAQGLYQAPRRLGMTRDEAERRRDLAFYALLGVAVTTFALAYFVGGVTIYLQLIIDLALVAYGTLLIRTQQLAQERTAKVRFLPQSGGQVPEPQLVLHRSAN